jgi:uncharacterized protein (DUF1778 family)
MADRATTTLQTRLDPESKRAVEEAAKLRQVGLSDYVRLVLVPTAKREVAMAKKRVVQMTAEEQERFWQALQAPARPTKAQRELGEVMRGEG